MPSKNIHLENNVAYYVHQASCDGLNYYLAVPEDLDRRSDIFIGLPNTDLSKLSNEEIVYEISFVTEALGKISKKGIFLVPDIAVKEIQEATLENDNRLYKILFDKIQTMVVDACTKLGSNEKFKISRYQVINFIRVTDEDFKFFSWLEMYMGNFIKVINLSEIIKKTKNMVKDPFTDNKVVFDDHTSDGNGNVKVTIGSYDDTLGNQIAKVKKKQKVSLKDGGFSSMSFIILILTISLMTFIILMK